MINVGEVAAGGLVEIRYHKLRSLLTLLGIILGTGSIIFMNSMLNGVIISVWDGISELGYDGVLYVVSRAPKDGVERARFGLSYGLRPEDTDVILSRRELVTDAAPVQHGELLFSYGSVRREVRVSGVTPSYAAVRRRHAAEGRFFNANDVDTFSRVCVLGHRLRQRLFGSENPLDKEVLVAGQRFRVVGVGEELGNQFVNDSDFIQEMEGAYVPITTLRKYVTGEPAPISYIAVKTRATDQLERVQAELQASLSAAHHGVQDFRVENIAQEMVRERDQAGDVIFNWQVVLTTIAGIALLIGGLGLLSVMLISINERLYEIGMRKAIGASDLEIFTMILVESATLALVGAGLGTIVALGFVKLVEPNFKAGLPISWSGVASAIAVALALGVLFGLYPALKASRLSPVEAMRGA